MTTSDLSLLEARVLGVLVEKQHTVPDTYPLTLNALVAGCNQKTSRDPILAASDTDVREALDDLKGRSMVMETSGGRAMRYAHNVERALAFPSQSVALLATLFLRGPQTAGELRINAERLHRFGDISAVEGFLHELAERPGGALVAELARAPGMRETRWMQLLTGPAPAAAVAQAASARDDDAGAPPFAALARELAALREEVAALRDELAAVRAAASKYREEPPRASTHPGGPDDEA
jgi:uncharacterized protein YceH (UPF0502 family)